MTSVIGVALGLLTKQVGLFTNMCPLDYTTVVVRGKVEAVPG